MHVVNNIVSLSKLQIIQHIDFKKKQYYIPPALQIIGILLHFTYKPINHLYYTQKQ